jgi:glutamate racemase
MATRNKKVGIIGTEATVNSNAYPKAIKALDKSIEVLSFACPLFVPLVEEGWTEGNVADMIAEKYLCVVRDKGVDTVVLGCTHYPLLKKVIGRAIGEGVKLIDSAVETSGEVRNTLSAMGLRKEDKDMQFRDFYVTDSPERFLKVGEQFLQHKIGRIEKIEVGG